MNRKQKIIVSVTGIFLVLLILVGLTYAYFLTQITGNTNSKSISVTTADLRVVYGDGTKELLTSSTKLIPSSNAINTKDFTVTNTGDDTHYAVIIENVIAKNATTDDFTTFESNDFRYTLTCTKKNGSSCNGVSEQTVLPMSDNILVENDIAKGDVHTYVITLWYIETNKDQSADMNKTLEARINIEDPNRINPYSSNTNSLAYNVINNALNVTNDEINDGYAAYRSIPLTKPAKELADSTKYSTWTSIGGPVEYVYYVVGDSYIEVSSGYKLVNPKVVKYPEEYADLKGKYISDEVGYPFEESAITNAAEGKIFENVYKVGNSTSSSQIYYAHISNVAKVKDVTLSKTTDDYTDKTGFESYYFRGGVENNYVEFNGMCWRIVRIEGDGSVKLTLAKQGLCSTITDSDTVSAFIGTGNYGYTDDNYADYENSANRTTSMKYILNEWFNSKLTNVSNKLKSSQICVGNNQNKYNYHTWEADGAYGYENYKRLVTDTNASLICDFQGKTENSHKIFPLTADEVIFAGDKVDSYTSEYFLTENARDAWFTISISVNFHIDHAFYVHSLPSGLGIYGFAYPPGDGMVNGSGFYIRPAISLISNIELADNSGNGTKNNPYRVIES